MISVQYYECYCTYLRGPLFRDTLYMLIFSSTSTSTGISHAWRMLSTIRRLTVLYRHQPSKKSEKYDFDGAQIRRGSPTTPRSNRDASSAYLEWKQQCKLSARLGYSVFLLFLSYFFYICDKLPAVSYFFLCQISHKIRIILATSRRLVRFFGYYFAVYRRDTQKCYTIRSKIGRRYAPFNSIFMHIRSETYIHSKDTGWTHPRVWKHFVSVLKLMLFGGTVVLFIAFFGRFCI